jgi:predicted alpha/beta superfamily hydrolase
MLWLFLLKTIPIHDFYDENDCLTSVKTNGACRRLLNFFMFRFKSQAKKERLRVVYVLDGNDIEDEIEIDMDK